MLRRMSAQSARARQALIGLAALCVTVLGGCERSERRTEEWNVLFVLSDALRAPSLSMYGYPRKTTPVLSQFARDGVLFERHFSAAPYTRLSTSPLMTSRLFAPMLMGREHTHEAETELPDDVLVLPTLLREHGYRTLLVTSHAWFSSSAPILARFDQHEVVTRKGASYVPYEDLMPAVGRALDSAVAAKQPFFFYLHSMDTHHPYHVHEHEGLNDHIGDGKADKRYDAYDSEIRYTDRWFGEVLGELERRGLANKTLVVFTSDHGEEFGEMGAGWSDETHGYQVRRAATHVPLILRLPPSHGVSGSFHDVTSHLDLAPTLAALAVPKIDLSRYRFEGADLSRRILRRRFDASTRAVYAINGRFFALRRGDEPGVDAIYDRWSDQAALHAYRPDRSNYPKPKEIVDAGKRAAMLEVVAGLARAPAEHFLQLPELSRATGSGSYPVSGIVPAFGERPAVYETRKDEHWSLYPDRALTCRPDEDCGPIGLAVASGVPKGRYKLGVKLRAQSRKRGYENEFVLTVVSDSRRTLVRFSSGSRRSVASDKESLDAGVHWLEGPVQVIVDKPRGGVDIAAFTLDSLDQATPAPRAVESVDSELTERLRALGYVE